MKKATASTRSAKAVSSGKAQAAGRVKGHNGANGSKRATGSGTEQDWQPRQRTRFVTEVAGGTRRAADLLEVAPSQPSRWLSGESLPGPAQARMLVDIDHVLAHALLVWADVRVARDWLTTPNARLDGARPVEWIRMHGTADVVEALRAEAAGSYA